MLLHLFGSEGNIKLQVHAVYQDELAQPQRARDVVPLVECGAIGNDFLSA